MAKQKKWYKQDHSKSVQTVLHIKLVLKHLFEPLSIREKMVFGLILLFALNYSLSYSGVALTSNIGKIKNVPAQACHDDGGWQNSGNAAGKPDLGSDAGSTLFTSTNSAVGESGGGKKLQCSNFGELTDTIVNPSIGVSLAVVENTQLEPLDETESGFIEPDFTSFIQQRTTPIQPGQITNFESSTDFLTMYISTDAGENWQTLYSLEMSEWSNFTNGGYLHVALPTDVLEDLDRLKVAIELGAATERSLTTLVDSVFLSYEIGQHSEVSIEAQEAQLQSDGSPVIIPAEESIYFNVSSKNRSDSLSDGLSAKLSKLFGVNESSEEIAVEAQIFDSQNQKLADVSTSVDFVDRDITGRKNWRVTVDTRSKFNPGTHTAKIIVTDENGAQQSLEQDFLWGVLAINTDKSSYSPGDKAFIQLSVLNNHGEPVCDADVEVVVKKAGREVARLHGEDYSLEVSQLCNVYGDHIDPDYSGHYVFENTGTYELMVVAKTRAGEYSITEVIEVIEAPTITISRTGPTRIYPPLYYPVTVTVHSSEDVSGIVEERVPKDFTIRQQLFSDSYSGIREDENFKYIQWLLNLKAGESTTLGYEFDAPDITPEFFLLGPLTINGKDSTESVFIEQRQWQLASDAIGDFAIYRESSALDAIGTGTANIDWDSTVSEGSSFSKQSNNTDIDLADGGHYLVQYSVPTESASGSGVSELQSWLRLNDTTDLAYGRAQGTMMRTDNNDEAYNSAATIIEATAGDDLRLQMQRSDSNSASVRRRSDKSGVSILKLDDNWEYLRSRPASSQSIGTSTNFVDVNLGVDDEIDTGTFSRSDSQVTLSESGHYLVTYNIGVKHIANHSVNDEARVVIDDTEIEGSRVSTFMNGVNGGGDGAMSWAGIIETDMNNQVLSLQIRRESETNPTSHTIKENETGLTIVKLPDTADYLSLGEVAGGQDLTTTRSGITWDAIFEEDTSSFDHNTSFTERVDIETTADYLFFSTLYAERPAGSSTVESQLMEWRKNSLLYSYGSGGQINRGDQTGYNAHSSGSSAGIIANTLTDVDYIELTQINEATNSTAAYQSNRMGLQGVNINSLFEEVAITRQNRFRWRDNTTDLNSSGGWLANEDSSPASFDKETTYRLRLQVANVGNDIELAARQYELQFAGKNFASQPCEVLTSWTGVADASDELEMATTIHIDPDGENTTSALLSSPGGYSYVQGEGREVLDTTATTGPLDDAEFTELEYSVQATDKALTGASYCLRLYDTANNTALDEYSSYPVITVVSQAINELIGEYGTIELNDNSWSKVNLANSYTNLIATGSPRYIVDSEVARSVRIRNKTATSFEIKVDNDVGSVSDTTTVDWLAMESGSHQMSYENGLNRVTAGSVSTSDITCNGDFSSGQSVTFSPAFTGTPAVIHTVSSQNSSEWVTSHVDGGTQATTPTTASMRVALLDSYDGCSHSTAEDIDYIAFDEIHAATNGIEYEALVGSGSVACCSPIGYGENFATVFSSRPQVHLVAQMGEADGGGGFAVSHNGRTTSRSTHYGSIDEDGPSADRTHSNETVAIIAFAASSGEINGAEYYFDQTHFRFYENTDAVQPTIALADENTLVSGVNNGDVVRIRTALQIGQNSLEASQLAFKLQYQQNDTCSESDPWIDVGSLSSSAAWIGYDNPTPADGAGISANLLSPSTSSQSYAEVNNSPTNPNQISAGGYGEWDWAVQNNSATEGATYCFRMVTSGDEAFSDDPRPLYYSEYAKATVTDGITDVSIYPSIPRPIDKDQPGWYSVTVYNPTSSSISVTQVNFKQVNTTLEMFNGVATQGYPSSGWTGVSKSHVRWSGTDSIPAKSSRAYYAKIDSNRVDHTSAIEASAVIDSNTYTHNLYTTQEFNADRAFASLWLDTNGNPATPNYVATEETQTTTTYTVVLAEESNKNSISTGGTLTINIPSGFSNISCLSSSGWNTPSVCNNGRIVVTNSSAVQAGTLSFNFEATAPTVDIDKVFLLHANFAGSDGGGSTVQPHLNAGVNVVSELDSTISEISIFPSIPRPIDKDQAGWYGVTLFNPTSSDITVSQVNIKQVGTGQDMFNAIDTQGFPAANWAKVSGNHIRWSGTQTIAAHQTKAFYVKIKSNKKDYTSVIEASAIINSNTYSNTLYTTQNANADVAFASLWLDTDASPSTPEYAIEAESNATQTFTVVLAEESNKAAISSGGTLTITLPESLSDVSCLSSTGWGTPSVCNDNAIVVSNTATAQNSQLSFSFEATTPNADGDELYRLHANFNGVDGSGYTVDPNLNGGLKVLAAIPTLVEDVSIFPSIPRPIDKDQSGWYEVTVFNPTTSAITVSQVNFQQVDTAFDMFRSLTTTHSPASGWSLVSKQHIRWSGSQSVAAKSIRSFYVHVQSDSKNALSPIKTTVVIDSTTYNGRQYTTESVNANTAFANLWIDTDSNPANQEYISSSQGGDLITYKVVLAESANKSAITAGGTLTITLPDNFQNVTCIASTGWNTPTICNNQQIIVSNSSSAINSQLVFTFQARSPKSQTDNLYLLQANYLGVDNDSHTVNPFLFAGIDTEPTPYTNELNYRWFANQTGASVGSPLADENTVAQAATSGSLFRLRHLIGTSYGNLYQNGHNFKLQVAQRSGVCDTTFNGESYADVVTGSGAIRYADNTGVTDAAALTASANDPNATGTEIAQSVEEANTFTASQAQINAGNNGLWDFVLVNNSGAENDTYCFRVIESDGRLLDAYSILPEVYINEIEEAPSDPTDLMQASTGGTALTVGSWINESTLVFSAEGSDPDPYEELQLCIEVQPITTAFSGSETSCSDPVIADGTTELQHTISSLSDAAYHWQARLKDSSGTYSNWVVYGGNSDGSPPTTPADIDAGVDVTMPTGTVYDGSSTGIDVEFNSGSLNELSANWDIDAGVSGLDRYEYSIGRAPGATDVLLWTPHSTADSVTVDILDLKTSQAYYFNVRAYDNAGNLAVISSDGQYVAPTLSFNLSDSNLTFDNLSPSNNYTDVESSTLTTSTNAYRGYIIRSFALGQLQSINNPSSSIGVFDGGSYLSPDGWLPTDRGWGYHSSDSLVDGQNLFNPSTCAGGNSPPCFAPFALGGPGDIIADNPGPVLTSPIVNESFVVNQRVSVDTIQDAGTYRATVIYIVTARY